MTQFCGQERVIFPNQSPMALKQLKFIGRKIRNRKSEDGREFEILATIPNLGGLKKLYILVETGYEKS